jgi:GT2 family glycosyltransferase
MDKPLSVVIVNWNSGDQLKNCVDSLIQHHEDKVDLVVIVDNASEDASVKQIREDRNFPFQLKILRNTINRGFAAACNQGAALCEAGRYILFLNPDARLFASSLSLPVEYMDDTANLKVGIASIQLIDDCGQISRSCARFPSTLIVLAQAFGIDKVLPRLGHMMAEWDHRSDREVDQVIGAFFLVRRALFNQLGGFDERFFVYYEEVDFALRAKHAGWSSMYLAGASAYHAGGGTSNQVKAKRLFYILRSRLLYIGKHFSLPGILFATFATMLVEPITRSLLALVRGSPAGVKETASAYMMLIREFPAMARQKQ